MIVQNLSARCLQLAAVVLVVAMASGSAYAAVPTLYLDQSSISGVSDTFKVSRLPVLNAGGTIRYYDVQFKLQVDAAGAPVLAPLNPVISLSPALIGGTFITGNYKDYYGNVYLLSGPGVASGGRTSWSLILTKPKSPCCSGFYLQANWFTGPVTGHPLQTKLASQNITSSSYSWGTVNTVASLLNSSKEIVVGIVQSGTQLALHGFATATSNVESSLLTLNLCTTANPCP